MNCNRTSHTEWFLKLVSNDNLVKKMGATIYKENEENVMSKRKERPIWQVNGTYRKVKVNLNAWPSSIHTFLFKRSLNPTSWSIIKRPTGSKRECVRTLPKLRQRWKSHFYILSPWNLLIFVETLGFPINSSPCF